MPARRSSPVRMRRQAWRLRRFDLNDRIDSGKLPLVAVNCFRDEDEKPPEIKFFRIGRPTIADRIRHIRDYWEGARQCRLRTRRQPCFRRRPDAIRARNVQMNVVVLSGFSPISCITPLSRAISRYVVSASGGKRVPARRRRRPLTALRRTERVRIVAAFDDRPAFVLGRGEIGAIAQAGARHAAC